MFFFLFPPLGPLFFDYITRTKNDRWWPHGEWEDFHAASFFILWLFIWDDTLDAHDHDLSDDFDGAKIFRQQTTDYIKHCLGLWKESDGPEPPCPSVSCSLFKDFSDRVVKKFKQGLVACPAKSQILAMYEETFY